MKKSFKVLTYDYISTSIFSDFSRTLGAVYFGYYQQNHKFFCGVKNNGTKLLTVGMLTLTGLARTTEGIKEVYYLEVALALDLFVPPGPAVIGDH